MSGAAASYVVDLTDLVAGILPPIVARFVDGPDGLAPLDISVGAEVHEPGDPTWDRAKRLVNAADARHITFGRHLLDAHLIVGQAFALAAYDLPHLAPAAAVHAVLHLRHARGERLRLPGAADPRAATSCRRASSTPTRPATSSPTASSASISTSGSSPATSSVGASATWPDNPYVEDAALVWPAFVEVVERHLDDLGLDDAAIAGDRGPAAAGTPRSARSCPTPSPAT